MPNTAEHKAGTADLTALREQHAGQIRENALRIQEFASYVIARVDAGHADAVGMYAADIVAAGQRIMTGHATIQGLDVLIAGATREWLDRNENSEDPE